jgi:hypothetical protein
MYVHTYSSRMCPTVLTTGTAGNNDQWPLNLDPSSRLKLWGSPSVVCLQCLGDADVTKIGIWLFSLGTTPIAVSCGSIQRRLWVHGVHVH